MLRYEKSAEQREHCTLLVLPPQIQLFSPIVGSYYRCNGIGIGLVFGSLVIAYSRNPTLKDQMFSYAILGFALSEAMGLFCLMLAF
ncbi:hypothetical protein J6590_024458, partial [Homalodisca vitripennis]